MKKYIELHELNIITVNEQELTEIIASVSKLTGQTALISKTIRTKCQHKRIERDKAHFRITSNNTSPRFSSSYQESCRIIFLVKESEKGSFLGRFLTFALFGLSEQGFFGKMKILLLPLNSYWSSGIKQAISMS